MTTITDVDIDVKIDEKINDLISEPSRYNVIFMNDNTTPMEWVIELLTTIFKHSSSSAEALTLEIHNNESAVVGTYSYEIAEQKTIEATQSSREHGFSLQIKLESEWMSNLKELTWEHHKNAERQKFVKELMSGNILKERYATLLFNLHPHYLEM